MIIIRVKNGGFVSDHKKLNTKKKIIQKPKFFLVGSLSHCQILLFYFLLTNKVEQVFYDFWRCMNNFVVKFKIPNGHFECGCTYDQFRNMQAPIKSLP